MIVRRVVYLINPPERTQKFPRSLPAFLRFSGQNQFHLTPHIIEWVGCKRVPWTRGASVSFVHWRKYSQNKARRRHRLAIGAYAGRRPHWFHRMRLATFRGQSEADQQVSLWQDE
jgi:hypothetical protein